MEDLKRVQSVPKFLPNQPFGLIMIVGHPAKLLNHRKTQRICYSRECTPGNNTQKFESVFSWGNYVQTPVSQFCLSLRADI